MVNASVHEDVALESLVAQVADEFLERQRRGEKPKADEYAAQHPEAADLLRKVLASLEVVGMSAMAGEPGASATGDKDAVTGTLGDYRILGEIGRGGMGIVYEAEQISLGRRVALKVLPFAATMDKRQLQRFLNEARAAAWLRHPHIVPVYAVGCTRGVNYYAMQFIDGQSLETLLQSQRRDQDPASPQGTDETATLPHAAKVAGKFDETTRERAKASTLKSSKRGRDDWRRVAELAVQAAEALEHAHQSGVIHRDVKPANLMLDENGDLWVTDFGLAQVQTDTRLTMTGDLIGTLRYMSPEQALAKRVIVDHRTDIYSLGATFYEVLTLKPVFEGQDRQELLRQIAFEEPLSPRKLNRAIPVELETVILKALEKNPADRYSTAKEMADDLKRYLNDEPTLARRPTLWQRGRKWSRRHVAAVRATAAAVTMTLLVVAGSFGWLARDQAAREEEKNLAINAARKEAERMQEQREARALAVRVALTEQAVNSALAESERLQGRRKMPQAHAMANQAATILNGGASSPALKEKVLARLADATIAADLEKLRSAEVEAVDARGVRELEKAYAAIFQRAGIELRVLTAEEAGQRIRQHSVAVELAAALDDWANVAKHARPIDETWWKHLLKVACVADPDPLRKQLRQTLASGNADSHAALKTLATVPIDNLSPATVVVFARSLRSAGFLAEAFSLLRQAWQRHADDFWINAEIATVLSHRKERALDEEIRYCSVALALRPEAAAIHRMLGTRLFDKGRKNEGIAEFQEALRLDPGDARTHYDIGIAFKKMGQRDKAITAFRNAIRLRPGDQVAHHELAATLKAAGLLNDAIADYKATLALKPNDANVHYSLGLALVYAGKPEMAIVAYRDAIRFNSEFDLAYFDLALACEDTGRIAEAIDAYKESIRCDSTGAQAHNRLAWLLLSAEDVRLRDPKQAMISVKAAMELTPREPDEILNTLGVAYYRNGEWQNAVNALSRVAEIRKRNCNDTYFFLAMAHAKLGNQTEAKQWFDRGVEWLDENKAKLDPNLKSALVRWRAEAAEVLGLKEANAQGKK